MTKDEAFNALAALAREINPTLPADLTGHVVTITAGAFGAAADARKPAPSIERKPPFERRDRHYDSQGYCDNPGRGY